MRYKALIKIRNVEKIRGQLQEDQEWTTIHIFGASDQDKKKEENAMTIEKTIIPFAQIAEIQQIEEERLPLLKTIESGVKFIEALKDQISENIEHMIQMFSFCLSCSSDRFEQLQQITAASD